jgi:hypothetical protein
MNAQKTQLQTDVLEQVIESIEKDHATEKDQFKREALVRAALAGRRMIVFLEQARDGHQAYGV